MQLIFGPRLPAAGSKVYQIKIILNDFAPQIWRRVLVPEDFNFLEFSWTVILAMGWRNRHSWTFNVPGFEIMKEIFDFDGGGKLHIITWVNGCHGAGKLVRGCNIIVADVVTLLYVS